MVEFYLKEIYLINKLLFVINVSILLIMKNINGVVLFVIKKLKLKLLELVNLLIKIKIVLKILMKFLLFQIKSLMKELI